MTRLRVPLFLRHNGRRRTGDLGMSVSTVLRTYFLLSAIALGSSACASQYHATYGFVLEGIEGVPTSTSAKIVDLDFRDEHLTARWNVSAEQISVEVVNRSKSLLTFDWKDSGYHDIAGLPAEIKAGATTKMFLHPFANTHLADAQCLRVTKVSCTPPYLDHLYYLHYPKCLAGDLNLKECGGKVRVRDPLLPLVAPKAKALEEQKGQKVRVALPVVEGGTALPYTFVFRVDQVKIEETRAEDAIPQGIVGACPCKKKYRSDEP